MDNNIPIANVVSVDTKQIQPSAPMIDVNDPPPPYTPYYQPPSYTPYYQPPAPMIDVNDPPPPYTRFYQPPNLQYQTQTQTQTQPQPPQYQTRPPQVPIPIYDQTTGIRFDAMDRYRNVVERYGISMFFALKMRELDGYKICVICDDSGSMQLPVTKPNEPFAKSDSRWDEAKKSLKIIVDIASVFDSEGIDIYYLNRQPILNVTSSEELCGNRQFNKTPNGSTPLGETIQKVLSDKKHILSERKMLLIIFTDGEPTNMSLFNSVLTNRKPIDNVFVTIVACTDDDDAVGYLNDLDKKIRNLDTCDDYLSELVEIQKVQGRSFSFTFGDYITKILLGSVNKTMDSLDEKKLNQNELKLIQKSTAQNTNYNNNTDTNRKAHKKGGCVIS